MRLKPHITTTGVILALGMTAAPAAAGNAAATRPAVRSNPGQQPPTEEQRPVQALRATRPARTASCAETCSRPPPSTTSIGPRSNAIDNVDYGTPNTPPTIIRVTTPRGFAWGDAGVGAAGAIGLAMLTLGLVLVVSQRRTRQTANSNHN